MTNSQKVKIGLLLWSLVTLGVGCWLLFPSFGWRGVVGVILILWGNNIGVALRNGQEVRKMEAHERFLDVLNRFEERYPR